MKLSDRRFEEAQNERLGEIAARIARGEHWQRDGRGCEKLIRNGKSVGGIVHLTSGFHATIYGPEQPFVRFDARREARAFVEAAQ